jgi:HlyD family secretion protein
MANNKSKSKSERKIILFSILGLLVVAGVVASRFAKRPPPIAIATEKVARRNITEVVVANGKIEPVLQVKISPEVSGEIIELHVKEGQSIKKGDLLFKIKPDNYLAASNSAQANYNSAVANRETAKANLEKAYLEYKRNDALFKEKLISDSDFLAAKTTYDVAKSTLDGAIEQISIAHAQLDSAKADLFKTTVYAPLTGTVSKLNSELGERVVGTGEMAGTEIMTVADLNNMEARVDIGEIDVPLIKLGQKASLEVDSFKDQKFNGLVTAIANSANNNDTSSAAAISSSTSTEATKFQVKILITEKERFLPGMSVTANIETRYRTNVISVPIQSVTTRIPTNNAAGTNTNSLAGTNTNNLAGANTNNLAGAKTNSLAITNTLATTNASTNGSATNGSAAKKADEPPKPVEVVFILEGDHVKQVPVKRGISDDNYVEITDGLKEGQEVVSGGYKAINRDLEDGKKVVVNAEAAGQSKEKKPN